MMRLHYLFCFLLIAQVSLSQEQLTFFKGDQCCYSVNTLIEKGNFKHVLLTDQQDGVKIYQLHGTDTLLAYSNDDLDKTYLFDHGQREDFYYFIFNDRLEIFWFDRSILQTYDFDSNIDEYHGQEGVFYMTDHGFIIIPKDSSSFLQFYNLETEKFEERSYSASRQHTKFVVDSFLIYVDRKGDSIHLHSHNIVNNEMQLIYSTDNQYFEIDERKQVVYFLDKNDFYITRGKSNNTQYIFHFDSPVNFYEFYIEDEDTVSHLYLSAHEELEYFRVDWEKQLIDSIHFEHDNIGHADYYQRVGDKILVNQGYWFLIVDLQSDAVKELKGRFNHRHAIDSNVIYYRNDWMFWKYDLESATHYQLSEQILTHDIEQIYKSNDSLFYFIADDDNRASDGLQGFYVIDLSTDTTFQLISVGDHSEGKPEMELESVQDILFLRTDQEIFNFDNTEFRFLLYSDRELPILDYKGEIYLISDEGNSFSINHWKDRSTLIPVIENVTYYSHKTKFVQCGEEYFVYTGLDLLHLKLEQGEIEILRPSIGKVIKGVLNVNSDDFLIVHTRNSSRQYEYWAYNVKNGSWVRLDIGDYQFLIYPEYYNYAIINGRMIYQEWSTSTDKIRSVCLSSGKEDIIYEGVSPGYSPLFYIIPICENNIGFYINDWKTNEQRLLLSDGTIGGTQIKDIGYPSNGITNVYTFEEQVYFTAIDSHFTLPYAIDCANLTLDSFSWDPSLISQGQYRLHNNRYVLGNNRLPIQNLTIASINEDNNLTPLYISPNDRGFELDQHFPHAMDTVPTLVINDSLLAIAASFDRKGQELWMLSSNGEFERRTDLNTGPFDSEITEMTVLDNHIYFKGYQYGPGFQIWRIPIGTSSTSSFDASIDEDLLTIYPNPVFNQGWMHSIPDQKGLVTIFDASGLPVSRFSKPLHQESTPLPVEDLPSGIYFIQFKAENGKNLSGRFLKLSR